MTFTPDSLPNLLGKVYLVTGGNAGIGYQTVLHLASHYARVYLCARSESKAQAAIASMKDSIKSAHPNVDADIRFLHMDLTSLSSVATAARTFLSQETSLHGLVNNAGIMATAFAITPDGYEEQWQVNYLSHYLLTSILLPTLLATASAPGSKDGDARIVDVTSNGHGFPPKEGIDFADINQEKGGVWTRYGQSKLGNILHAKLLNQRYGPQSDAVSKIWTAAVHPGSVDTQLNKQISMPLASHLQKALQCFGVYVSPDKGAYGSLFCVASPEFKPEMSGGYFVPDPKAGTKVGKPSKFALDTELAAKLGEWSEKELKGKGFIS